jgi:hypothetical protein
MRPLIRPTQHPIVLPDQHSAFHLMNHYGHYCAFSEEPIFDTVATWNPVIIHSSPLATRHDPIEGSLPIAPATFDAWNQNRERAKSYLRPDEHLTFSISKPAFTYELEKVEVIFLDEEGEPVQTEERNLVIVRGSNEQSNSTIDIFALNTNSFDAKTNQLKMSHSDYLSRVDHRLFNRTDTWIRATQIADMIEQSPKEGRVILAQHAGGLASLSGFWSVWATIFLSRFQDDNLAQLMLSSAQTNQPQEIAPTVVTGSGIHNIFPNTHQGWLS